MDTGSPKRQRLTPVPNDSAADMDISHVSDSMQKSSAFQRPIARPTSSKAREQSSDGQVPSLLNRVGRML
jgi:hypothetical protein